MRSQFLLFPAALVASGPAVAGAYLTVEQAQSALFPNAKLAPADITLSPDQVDQLIKETQVTVFHSKVKAWKVSTGGWFILDQVLGREDRVTYAVGLDAAGAVIGVEVLVCDGGYTGVRDHRWLAQFDGRTRATSGNLVAEVTAVSGATLSSDHISEGVKRVLATFAMFIGPHAG